MSVVCCYYVVKTRPTRSLGMRPTVLVHIHPHMSKRSLVIGTDEDLRLIFIVGPASAGTTAQEIRLLLLGNYITPNTTLQRYSFCFLGIILHPTQHFRYNHHYKYGVISTSINFPHPGISCPFNTAYVHDDLFTGINNDIITWGTCKIQKYNLRSIHDINVKPHKSDNHVLVITYRCQVTSDNMSSIKCQIINMSVSVKYSV